MWRTQRVLGTCHQEAEFTRNRHWWPWARAPALLGNRLVTYRGQRTPVLSKPQSDPPHQSGFVQSPTGTLSLHAMDSWAASLRWCTLSMVLLMPFYSPVPGPQQQPLRPNYRHSTVSLYSGALWSWISNPLQQPPSWDHRGSDLWGLCLPSLMYCMFSL
jgi:hypothetical protein